MMDQAIQDLVYIGNRFKGILDLVPFLEKVGTLENAIKERQNALDVLKQELDAVQFEIDSSEEEHLKKIEDAKTTFNEVENDVANLIGEANKEASKIIQTAKDQAEKIVLGGKDKLSQIMLDVESVLSQLDVAKQELIDVTTKRDEIQIQLDKFKRMF